MSKHRIGFTGWLLAAVITASAVAAEKGALVSMSGSTEAAIAYAFKSNIPTNSLWSVDYLNWNTTVTPNDRTKIVLNNTFAMGNQFTSVAGEDLNLHGSSNFLSNYVIGGTNFGMFNQAAYLEHKCGEGFHTAVGHFAMPFGMENMWDRYDMGTYYYSHAYRVARAYEWTHDVGVRFTLTDHVPGTLTFAIAEGISGGSVDTNLSPAAALRWHTDVKSGDMSFTPALSVYAGRWVGGPKDMGFGAGVGLKSGMWWANAELQYFSRNLDPRQDPKRTDLSVYVEPGFDLGFASVAAKLEMVNVNTNNATATSQSDFNVGASIGHTYAGNYRIRLAYAHTGLSGNVGYGTGSMVHVNDLRLLFGTKF